MDRLEELGVLTLVPRKTVPTGARIYKPQWVFFKIKADNSHKARLVVSGWGQVPGKDCGKTYAPVCRLQSVRMVLAIAAEMDWEVVQLDVNTAFLYSRGRCARGSSAWLREDGQRWSSTCLLYTSPSPRDLSTSRMPSSA